MLSTNSEILYIIITYNIESECPQQFAEVSLQQSGLLYLLTCQLTLFQIHPRMQVLLYRYICVHVLCDDSDRLRHARPPAVYLPVQHTHYAPAPHYRIHNRYDLDGAFEQLVLDLFDDNIFAVDQDENVTRTEVRCIRPALDRTIERVRWRGNNFLAAHENVRQLGRLVDIGFDDRLERNVSGFFIPRPNKIPRSDFFNCNIPCRCSNQRSGNKA